MHGKRVIPAGLLAGAALITCSSCAGSSQWVSHATFTIRHTAESGGAVVGPDTASDSTVPAGPSGNAEMERNSGSSPATFDFEVIIGGNPDDSTNLYQFSLELPNYRGVGSYKLRSGESGVSFDVTISGGLDAANETNIWSLERSHVAGCDIRVTAATATSDRTIMQVRGRISCHGLEDGNTATSSSDLTGRFDVFSEIWCDPLAPVQPCVTPSPD